MKGLQMPNSHKKTKQKPSIITLDEVSVRKGEHIVLSNISWQLQEQQHWLLTGPNGSGKSTFLQVLKGRAHPMQIHGARSAGTRSYTLNGRSSASPAGFGAAIALVSHDHLDALLAIPAPPTVASLLRASFTGGVFALSKNDLVATRIADAAAAFDLHKHLHKGLAELSRGQALCAVLAAALLPNPRVLLLDEALDNLDAAHRKSALSSMEAAARSGTSIVMASHHPEEAPAFLTHVLELDSGRILRQGLLRKFPQKPGPHKKTSQNASSSVNSAANGKGFDSKKQTIFKLRDIDVFVDGVHVLHHLNWTVRKGRHWAVLGGNGSGKTTLLLLLSGLLPAYAGKAIERFGKSSGIDLRLMRRRLGMVSPELQSDYSYNMTALNVTISGFFASIGLYENVDEHMREAAHAALIKVGMQEFAQVAIGKLSYGQKRRVLIARALVAKPEVLLLDEADTGLDAPSRRAYEETLEALAAGGIGLIMTSHRTRSLPSFISHFLVLRGGRIVFRDTREAYEKEGGAA
jgi:molybdate transport system ATP-binding protein